MDNSMRNDARVDATKSAAQTRWYRVNLWLHRWTSLVATLPFLILCLTGTILIFHDEIDSAMGVLPPSPGLAETQRPLAEAVSNTLAAYPDEKVALVGIDPDNHPGLLLIGTVPLADSGFDRMTRRFAHLASAELTSEHEVEGKTLTGFLFELHAQWFLGPAGAVVGGLIGVLVVISLVSGLVVYAPHARRVAFGVFRRGKGPRLYQLDLHNFIGAIVLGWALVVALTGFFLGVGTIVTGAWAQKQLQSFQSMDESVVVDQRAPPVNVDTVVARALEAAPPGWSVEVIFWPGTDLTSHHNYAVRVKGSGIDERLFRVVLVDAVSGNVIETVELPWYIKIIALSQPLHFGDYGGLPLKLLWTTCTWLTLFITVNGAWLWWSRRGKRRSTHRITNSDRVPV